MLSFVNDYSEGAHEQVLRRLAETNREQHPGYGTDPYCARAKEKIRRACGCPEGDVFFLVGGTQTNQAVISALSGKVGKLPGVSSKTAYSGVRP